jgi:renalase
MDVSAAESATIVVVGAGLAGLAAASSLHDSGFDVLVLDKGRGPGGRSSTRREILGSAALGFDHGAQYFTVRDPDFEAYLAQLPLATDLPGEPREMVVREWTAPVVALEAGRIKGRSENTRRFVFAPGMNALSRLLAHPLRCRFSMRVTRCVRTPDGWVLEGEDERPLARCQVLAVTAPAPQTLELLPDEMPFRERLATVRYAPSWAVMAHFGQSLECAFGGAFVDGSPLSWIANNDSKPGRERLERSGESWVLLGTPEWSYAHRDDTPESVAEALLVAFGEALAARVPVPALVRAHRWRYALPTSAVGSPCLWDPQWQLGIAGDGCPAGARVEGAFVSGRALARRIRRALGTST